MKKLIYLAVATVVMALTSCKFDLNKLGGDLIDPSDNIITKEYKLTAFEEVDMTGVGHVQLIQSDTKNGVVELTAPDNYIDLYKFESQGGKLRIGFTKSNINIHTKNVEIKVYTTDLIKIRNSGASHISMDSLDTDKLDIINSGVGEIYICGIADDVVISNSGVGAITAHNLKALNVKANVSGVGSVQCYASESLDASVTGVGSLKYMGHPKHKSTHRSGVGSISEM